MRTIQRLINFDGYTSNSATLGESLGFYDETKPMNLGSPHKNLTPADSEVPFDHIPEGRI